MSETLILYKNIPNWQTLWHIIHINSPFQPHWIILSFVWVCTYMHAHLWSPESVLGVSLPRTYKTYIFKQTHWWEWFQFLESVSCHYFCLFCKYHMALFFPLGMFLGSSPLSLGLWQFSLLSFLKSCKNRGKRIFHVGIGCRGHLGLVLAPELKKKIKKWKGKGRSFSERAASL